VGKVYISDELIKNLTTGSIGYETYDREIREWIPDSGKKCETCGGHVCGCGKLFAKFYTEQDESGHTYLVLDFPDEIYSGNQFTITSRKRNGKQD
jgi:hypothetical protein